jgi:phosphoglycolate phosphatase-like HAD superfamily hydrolase
LTLHRGYSTGVLAEFDTQFNGMACDALRYHLSVDGVASNEDERRLFEDLIRRLDQPPPAPTAREKAAIDTWKGLSGPDVYVTGGGYQKFERHQLSRNARWALESWQSRQRVDSPKMPAWPRSLPQMRMPAYGVSFERLSGGCVTAGGWD